jgi:hypothetical protein
MGGIVVEDHMDQFACRHLAFDRVEEADELLMPVALRATPENAAW